MPCHKRWVFSHTFLCFAWLELNSINHKLPEWKWGLGKLLRFHDDAWELSLAEKHPFKHNMSQSCFLPFLFADFSISPCEKWFLLCIFNVRICTALMAKGDWADIMGDPQLATKQPKNWEAHVQDCRLLREIYFKESCCKLLIVLCCKALITILIKRKIS